MDEIGKKKNVASYRARTGIAIDAWLVHEHKVPDINLSFLYLNLKILLRATYSMHTPTTACFVFVSFINTGAFSYSMHTDSRHADIMRTARVLSTPHVFCDV
jgi:hypothetical protein